MTHDNEKRRRQAYGRGLWAESAAAWLLRLKGYRILARRWRTPVGEIDLIARKGRLVVFVEVKRRAVQGAALDALTPRQMRRIERAAFAFLQRNAALADCDLRFDLVVVAPGRRPHHMIDAWRPLD